MPGHGVLDAGLGSVEARDVDRTNMPRPMGRHALGKDSFGGRFAAAVLPICAQTVIETDTRELDVGETKIATADGTMPGYYAKPAGKSGLPTVLVAQEIFGVHEHIRDVCRRFAKEGFLAVAPELYARHGDPTKYSDISQLISEIVAKVADAQVVSDLDAAAAWARSNGGNGQIGITGFCWGGRVVWIYAAHNPGVRAAVAWYGPVARSYFSGDPTVLEIVSQITVPVLGLYGAADGGIPNEGVEKAFALLKQSGNSKSEYVLYPDTPHAFYADYRPGYRKEAADDGWRRCVAWFRKNGVV